MARSPWAVWIGSLLVIILIFTVYGRFVHAQGDADPTAIAIETQIAQLQATQTAIALRVSDLATPVGTPLSAATPEGATPSATPQISNTRLAATPSASPETMLATAVSDNVTVSDPLNAAQANGVSARVVAAHVIENTQDLATPASANGKWIAVDIAVTNTGLQPARIAVTLFSLRDDQGRTFSSDHFNTFMTSFETNGVFTIDAQPSIEYVGTAIFFVAQDAQGFVLLLDGSPIEMPIGL